MKHLKSLILLAALLLVARENAMAQDRMLLRGKTDTLLVKVTEIGTDDVKYKLWPVDTSMPVIVEKKEKIRRIILENGTILRYYDDNFSDPTNYVDQRKMVIKADMLTVVRKVMFVSFEKSLKPGASVEVGLGVIGLGGYTSEIWDFAGMKGGFLRVGYKFINKPDFHLKGMRFTHILKGGYIKPELMLLSQTSIPRAYSNYNSAGTGLTYKTTGYALFLNFGKQWVMDNIFAVDLYTGIGIGAKNTDVYLNGSAYTGSTSFFNDLHLRFRETGGFGYIACTARNNEMAFCLQGGLKLGILIGNIGKNH